MGDDKSTTNDGTDNDNDNDNDNGNHNGRKMQSLRKKLSDFEAGKEEEVKRLVLEAKENMRDEVGVRARKRQQNMVLLLCYCVVLLPLQKTRS